MWWLLTLGCAEDVQDSALMSLILESPNITDVEWGCVDDLWTVSVTTEGWTGNGYLWLGTTERYERHPLYSIQSASDGSADLLRIKLESTSDWRDAQAGQLTGFHCIDVQKISGQIMILDPQSLDAADCYTFVGENTSVEDVWGDINLPDCSE